MRASTASPALDAHSSDKEGGTQEASESHTAVSVMLTTSISRLGSMQVDENESEPRQPASRLGSSDSLTSLAPPDASSFRSPRIQQKAIDHECVRHCHVL